MLQSHEIVKFSVSKARKQILRQHCAAAHMFFMYENEAGKKGLKQWVPVYKSPSSTDSSRILSRISKVEEICNNLNFKNGFLY